MKPKSRASQRSGSTDERLKRLGNEMRRYREAAGLTQGQLARRVGKSTATISKIESAKQPLDVPTFLDIADELHVAPEELFLRIELAGKSRLSPQKQQILAVFQKALGGTAMK